MMWTLIKKDIRQNLLLIGSAALFSVMPYALATTNLFVNGPREGGMVENRDLFHTIQTAGYACLFLMVIMSGAFGGLSFALERRERTAEFLGMMPISRQRIAASKLLVAVICIAVFLSVHFVALRACDAWGRAVGLRRPSGDDYVLISSGIAAAYASLLFGVAWAMSTVLRSPAIAATVSIVVGAICFFGLTPIVVTFLERWQGGWHSEGPAFKIVCWFVVFVALVAIAFSTARYLRRVEP